MKLNATPMDRFEGWFIWAIEMLEELDEGDGAFAALMIALPLYERYIIAKLKLEGKPTGEAETQAEMSIDLGLDDAEQKKGYRPAENRSSVISQKRKKRGK